jgi:DNA-directed RNA polymerase subunit M/transcription elongation factor TFIIS
MAEFCDRCASFLLKDTVSGTLKFKCDSCHFEKKARDVDTLMYELTKTDHVNTFRTVLYNAHLDPLNPKARIACKKCSNKMVKQVRVGVDLKLINVCTKCKHRFLYE